MKPLDLLDSFDRSAGAYAFITTYEFDPQFFERRMLVRKGFAAADRIVVFMDRGRYQELINHGLPVSGFNRRYLVVPMDCAPYVFHPKLYLVLGPNSASGVVGSSNCTSGGIAYNTELCSAFSVREDAPHANDPIARSVLRQIYDAMKIFAYDATFLRDTLETQFFQPVERDIPWLQRELAIPKGEIELLHSHHTSLWAEVTKRLEPHTVQTITVISPFYDGELDLLKRLRERWPRAPLTIVAQQSYATLAGKKLAKLFGVGKENRLLAASPKPGRRLHAKAFAFETEAGTFWLTGSPNATLAALDGRNTEAALWLYSKETAHTLFEDDTLILEQIHPSDFESGTDQEPRNVSPVHEVVLTSAILGESGSLECEFQAAETVQGLTLRIRNFNEMLPVLSLLMRDTHHGTVRFELTENQIGQIRGAAICEIKGAGEGGTKVLSNPVSLVQLYHLLRERPAQAGGRNPLQAISETGENLVPYVDGLGSVREAVEFFDHCSIRFYDGEIANRGFGQGMWKPRDPFTADTPAQWLGLPAGSSTEDLRNAIWNFVERHQREKLHKHVRRGNLNGLPNFLDIFRTLNCLLLTYHQRTMGAGGPVVMPCAFVTTGIGRNLGLLIGPFDTEDDPFGGNGFVSSILANVEGDKEIVRERLREERVPQMLLAAVKAMIDARKKALNLPKLDIWSMSRLRWVSDCIERQGLQEPSAEDVATAGLEYTPSQLAA